MVLVTGVVPPFRATANCVVGLLVPLFGFALLGFARVYYRSDRVWIINAIKDAIRGVEN